MRLLLSSSLVDTVYVVVVVVAVVITVTSLGCSVESFTPSKFVSCRIQRQIRSNNVCYSKATDGDGDDMNRRQQESYTDRYSSSSSNRPEQQIRSRSKYDDNQDDAFERPQQQQWDDVNDQKKERRYYYEDDDDDDATNMNYYSSSSTEPEWEKYVDDDYGSCWVVLPPAGRVPTAILHFVGGAVVGSVSPNIWYYRLLSDLVIHTGVVIIVTCIPVTVGSNPLNHVKIAKTLRQLFQSAYDTVVVDEYGGDTLQSIPVGALGHSLGARILVVLSTLSSTSKYKFMILMSFTNYNAATGIPGISQLFKKSYKVKQQQRKQDDDDENRRRSNKYGSNKRRSTTNRRRRQRDDEYDDDDDELDDFMKEIGTTMNRIQSFLTPNAKTFEFYPSPQELWDATQHRYKIPKTLLIQFDQDRYDSSSKFASIVQQNDGTSTANTSSIKFARLRGNHLTPVQFGSNDDDDDGDTTKRRRRKSIFGKDDQFTKQMKQFVMKNVITNENDEEYFLCLRQSISRYLIDICI